MSEMDVDFGDIIKERGLNEISEERWIRAREEVDIFDVIESLTGKKPKGTAISCPFGHGVGATDHRPSFYLYKSSNCCCCNCFFRTVWFSDCNYC